MTHPLSTLKRKFNKFQIIKNKNQYVILSLNMIDIEDRNTVVLKLKDVKNGNYFFKTAHEILHEPEIAFRLGKQDLMQVSYLAGYEHHAMN